MQCVNTAYYLCKTCLTVYLVCSMGVLSFQINYESVLIMFLKILNLVIIVSDGCQNDTDNTGSPMFPHILNLLVCCLKL